MASKAQRSGEYVCDECDNKVQLARGAKIPNCPDCGGPYEENPSGTEQQQMKSKATSKASGQASRSRSSQSRSSGRSSPRKSSGSRSGSQSRSRSR